MGACGTSFNITNPNNSALAGRGEIHEEDGEYNEKFDPIAIKREKIMNKSRYSWKPSIAFIPDNCKSKTQGQK